MEYTLCNSFGFGGTNGSLIFKKCDRACPGTALTKGPFVGPFIQLSPLFSALGPDTLTDQ